MEHRCYGNVSYQLGQGSPGGKEKQKDNHKVKQTSDDIKGKRAAHCGEANEVRLIIPPAI